MQGRKSIWEAAENALRREPRTAKHAHLAREGVPVTPEMAAYLDDPNATVLCAHLAPVERAIRQAGLIVYPVTGCAMQAHTLCSINETELRKKFALPASVIYYEHAYQTEADSWLECRPCKCRISAEYPGLSVRKWFPKSP